MIIYILRYYLSLYFILFLPKYLLYPSCNKYKIKKQKLKKITNYKEKDEKDEYNENINCRTSFFHDGKNCMFQTSFL